MRGRPARRCLFFVLPAGLVFLSHILSPAVEPFQRASVGERAAPNSALAMMRLPGTDDIQLIIELSDPSVIEGMRQIVSQAGSGGPGGRSQQSRLDLRSTTALAHRTRVAASQRRLSERLAGLPGIRIESGIDTVMNALIVRMPSSDYTDLRTMPGVKGIHFSRPLRMLLDTSAILVNAQALWDRAGGNSRAGNGVKIGIIDTGIDISNPMFVDGSLTPPAGYPKGEPEFTNHKVIVARNYLKLLPGQQAVNSAQDEVGHGSFVAGVAAGKMVNAPLAAISGMAPGAFLGSYKVFGTPGINDFTTTAAVLAAINDAVADGMDVLNLSLGSLNDIPASEDPEIGALENAIAAGVVVVAAAGNEGPSARTIENPGTAPNAITVGSVSNRRTFVSHVHVTAPAPIPATLSDLAYTPGSGPAIDSPLPPTGIIDVASLDGSGESCHPLPEGSLAGSVALVLRKPCSFADKVGNTQKAGAAAVIVYNNNPSEGPVTMGGLEATNIPAVMISNADGMLLKQYIAENSGRVLVRIDDRKTQSALATIPEVLSLFSSVGPAADFDVKPDLVAVGENVYSAAQSTNPRGAIYNPTGFTLGQGTSFSAPMVAGAAAGLKQLFPGLSAYDLKSILTSSASPGVTIDGAAFASVLQSGSGLLDMGGAAAAGAIVSPSSLNFGARSYKGTVVLTRNITIRNISGLTDRYFFSVQTQDTGSTVTLSQDSSPPVDPGASASATFTIGVTSPRSGGFQGMVVVKSATSGASYRIPYWAGLYEPDSSRILKVAQDRSVTDSFAGLSEALGAARPGNIIEIADSATYPGGITIHSNKEGLPLHGITIRAAAGQTPTLDGSAALAAPGDIRVMGLRNVLIQGIRITGGITGLLLSQSSTSTPLSVTIDRCVIDRTSGAGIVAFSGASVEVTGSTISGSSGTGIVAIGGTLTLSGSSVRDNAADGIDALGVNVDIVKSSLTGNRGPGLNALGSYGTVDGSECSKNLGPSGDGLEIVNGTVTITNCTFDSNERAGVALLAGNSVGAGPSARVVGNTAHANKAYGILAGAGQNLYLDGNLVTDNGRGMQFSGFTTATLTNNIVLRSSDTAGNGIEATDQARIRAVNNTIYGNALHGIALDAAASAVVYNSIVAGNAGGDLQGLSLISVQNSLIGDGSVSGNGNIIGAAKLANPAQNDVRPAADSAAIDSGNNAAPDLPFTDYFRRLRVVPGVSMPYSGRPAIVDIGAVEASSSYPVIFPILANGDQAALGGSVAAGIALVNNDSRPANLEFWGYNASGLPIGGSVDPAARTIAPQGQISILGFQLLGFDRDSPLAGGILAGSTAPLNGFFLLFDSGFQHFATGIGASYETASDLVFMQHQSDSNGKTSYVLFNPGLNPANATATLYSPGGTIIGSGKTINLAPKGQSVFGFDDVTIASGFVRCRSDRPITGFELMGNSQGLNALAPAPPGSDARLFFPHIAEGGGFSTWIGIVNPTAIPSNIILAAYDDQGGILGARASVTLASNSQVFRRVSDLFHLDGGALQTGYVVAQGDLGGLAGFTSFVYADSNRQAAAALPSDCVPRQHLVFPHIAHQVPASAGRTHQTGIALLNPFGTPIQYTMSVFDRGGSLVAQKQATLAPRQKDSRFLSHAVAGAGFFSQPMSLAGGHVEVTSDYGLLGLELFFTEDFTQLAVVPAQSPARVP